MEVLIYVLLFSIVIGGGVASAYTVMENSGRNQTKAIVQAEGDFIIGKMNWAVSGATGVNQPVVGSQGSLLSVNKLNGANSISVALLLHDSNILMGDSTIPGNFILNNTNIKVTNLVFEHDLGSGDGANPERVTARFTLTANTPNGQPYSQDFMSSMYLRK